MARTSHGIEINHQEEPIRLFKSGFLEFFTHISPIVVLLIWLPVVIWFLVLSFSKIAAGAPWFCVPIGFLIGVVIWTFAEYTLHRFLFHHHAKSPAAQRVFFLFHGVHHAQPQCKTRLVMPPVVSIPMALVFYGLFYLVAGVLLGGMLWVAPLFSGFIAGYLLYDMAHYATHHFPMRSGYLKFLKRYHMQHHFRTPDKRFGVSSPVWDYVFRTIPDEPQPSGPISG
jgi:sterol desaturase/sphingolipid hydroxylase (fatty acid hydroxylase superfamily)